MLAIIVKSVIDSRNIQEDTESQLPFTVPFIWLTIGLFGMLPDVAWLPTAMLILVTIFAWITGRLEKFPAIDYLYVCCIRNRLQQQYCWWRGK